MKKHDGDPPACVDCSEYREGRCYSDECSSFDSVKGRQPVNAETERTRGHCGMSGKHFVPKPPPTWLDRHVGNILLLGLLAMIAAFLTKGHLW